MPILVVAATEFEIAPLAEKLGESSTIHPRQKAYKHRRHDIHLLISGVGMVATAAWCSRILSQTSYDLAFNLGLCGSFNPAFGPGQVVNVISDGITGLGAEDGDNYLTLQELKLLDSHEFPFQGGRLLNQAPPHSDKLSSLPKVEGVTSDTVHGNEQSIAVLINRFQPQVESMEGAAFMYACLINRVPFAQVRAVSNFVEIRNREAWNIADSISNLSEVALKIIDEL